MSTNPLQTLLHDFNSVSIHGTTDLIGELDDAELLALTELAARLSRLSQMAALVRLRFASNTDALAPHFRSFLNESG